MNAFFVPGSAYMTFQYAQATVNIAMQSNTDVLTFNAQKISATPTSFTGMLFYYFHRGENTNYNR
jgi:hypothetical protein